MAQALTKRQRKFVENFVLTNSPYHAGIAAGYRQENAERYGLQLLENPLVKEAIENRRRYIALAESVSQTYFVKHLKSIIEDKFSKTNDKITAIQLLAKITGHLKEQAVDGRQLVILKQEGLVATKERAIVEDSVKPLALPEVIEEESVLN